MNIQQAIWLKENCDPQSKLKVVYKIIGSRNLLQIQSIV